MEERRAAICPNCRCNPDIAAVRVCGGVPGEVGEAEAVADGEGGVVVDEPEVGCGGGWGGGWELDVVAEELAMASMVDLDTRLSKLGDLRRKYVCWTGGRGEGPRRRRRSDAVLAAGVQAGVRRKSRGEGELLNC
jgi:hypothetical protein